MSDQSNPGPPLVAEDEFCACQPPSTAEYLKASAAAVAVLLVGAGLWLGVVLLFQRISGMSSVLIALGAGWVVHRAAGRHRSVVMGILAAASGVLAPLLGFVMLWMPFFSNWKLPRQLDWYQLAMIGLGALVAFGVAGPRERRSKYL